jgi:hypothetical protein
MIGRPPDLSRDEVQDKVEMLCDLLKRGVPQVAACGVAGIPVSTLHSWKKRAREAIEDIPKGKEPAPDEAPFIDFLDRVEGARAEAEVRYSQMVFNAAQGGNVQAAMWWLDRAHPERWAQRQRVEVTGEDGEDLTIVLKFPEE